MLQAGDPALDIFKDPGLADIADGLEVADGLGAAPELLSVRGEGALRRRDITVARQGEFAVPACGRGLEIGFQAALVLHPQKGIGEVPEERAALIFGHAQLPLVLAPYPAHFGPDFLVEPPESRGRGPERVVGGTADRDHVGEEVAVERDLPVGDLPALLQNEPEQVGEVVQVLAGQHAVGVDLGVGDAGQIARQLDIVDPLQNALEVRPAHEVVLGFRVGGIQGDVEFGQADLDEAQGDFRGQEQGIGVDVHGRALLGGESDQALVAPDLLAQEQGFAASDVDIGALPLVDFRDFGDNLLPPVQAHGGLHPGLIAVDAPGDQVAVCGHVETEEGEHRLFAV